MTRPAYVICRSDGEPMDGDYACYTTDDPNDWAPVDGWDYEDPDTPVHYVMLRVDPVPVARRTIFPSGASKTRRALTGETP